MRLKSKVAIVTGASSGIGAGIARALGAEGATVVVNYAASKAGADAVVASIVANGGTAVAVQADMASSADVLRLFETAVADHGRLDILVNNAGVAQFEMADSLTEEAFHRQFNVNVLGYFLAVREAVRHFGDAGGSIVNISSILSTHPSPGTSIYAATKGAVDTMTYALARELGLRDIRVNAIMPGIPTRARPKAISRANSATGSWPKHSSGASANRRTLRRPPCSWPVTMRTGSAGNR